MRFNVISNLHNGVGLERDCRMLRRELEMRGHAVNSVMWNAVSAPEADTNIFVELVAEQMFKYASQQWAIPNPEWWFYDHLLSRIDLVLAKTADCLQVFRHKSTTKRAEFLGWQADDLLDEHVWRRPKFLHVAGKSQFKNTPAVLAAWNLMTTTDELTVIAEHYKPSQRNVQHFTRVDEKTLKEMMNSHEFHLIPAAYEGYGMALHEAMGVGAVVITTDAGPMNECAAAILISPCGRRQYHSGQLNEVSAHSVHHAIMQALQMSPAKKQDCRKVARHQFLADRKAFWDNLNALVGQPCLV